MALTRKEENDIIKNKSMKTSAKIRNATKIIVIMLIVALLLTGGTYGVLALIEANSMMISVVGKKEGLALCTNSNFESLTSKLNIKGPEFMDCYTYEWFNIDEEVLGKDGAHHGGSYICYSFYLKNISPTKPCLYTFGAKFTKNTKDMAAATRIMIIESDENCENETALVRVFAQAKGKDEEGIDIPEYISYNDCVKNQEPISLESLNSTSKDNILKTRETVPFVGEVINEDNNEDLGFYVLREQGRRLSHESYIKFTVMIWLEGTDLQCVDNILGGRCSIQFEFELEDYLDEIEDYGE